MRGAFAHPFFALGLCFLGPRLMLNGEFGSPKRMSLSPSLAEWARVLCASFFFFG
jgi:hypothetical protein